MSAHLERLSRLYSRLKRGPVTIEILSAWAKNEGIQVSDRQLYRDLKQLMALSVDNGEKIIEFTDEKNRKTWKMEFDESSQKITSFDINSFFLLKNFAPIAILQHRKSSIEKFENLLYKDLSRNKYQQLVEAGELYLRRTNYFDQAYGDLEHQQIEDLIWALHNKRVILIESITINPANIHLDDREFPIKMYPMELVFHRGRVYISGKAATDKKLLIFAVDRYLKFSLTNESFNRKKLEAGYQRKMATLFGIADPIDDKVYRIRIEFTEQFALSWMNYFWHSSQQWERLDNGNYMMHLHCSIGRELVGFIAFGLDKMKVHEPKILRDLIIKKLQQTLDVYHKDLPIDEKEANKDY